MAIRNSGEHEGAISRLSATTEPSFSVRSAAARDMRKRMSRESSAAKAKHDANDAASTSFGAHVTTAGKSTLPSAQARIATRARALGSWEHMNATRRQ